MKQLSALLAAMLVLTISYAQQNVGIGTNTPKASAKLDVQSTTQGVTLPSMTSTQRKAIANPAKGLLVFDTDKACFYYYDGQKWKAIAGSDSQDAAPVFTPQPAGLQDVDNFGSSIAMSEPFAAIGCSGKDTNGLNNPGAVYMYQKNAGGGWAISQVISPADLGNNSAFGFSVAIDSNYMVVGAPTKTEGVVLAAGRIYVYRYNGSSWVEETSIINPAGSQSNAQFGYSVGISSSGTEVTLAAGSPRFDFNGNTDAGALTIIRRNPLNGQWTNPFMYYGHSSTMQLGHSASINHNYCVSGAPNFDTTIGGALITNRGVAYLFRYNGASWQYNTRQFSVADTNVAFGYRTVYKDSMLAISGRNNTIDNNGSSYIWIYKQAASGSFDLVQTLDANPFGTEPDPTTCAGYSIALTKTHLLVGIPFQYAVAGSSCTSGPDNNEAMLFKWSPQNNNYLFLRRFSSISVIGNNNFARVLALTNTDFGIFGPTDAFSGIGVQFGSLEE